jgi:hypothetical protein
VALSDVRFESNLLIVCNVSNGCYHDSGKNQRFRTHPNGRSAEVVAFATTHQNRFSNTIKAVFKMQIFL